MSPDFRLLFESTPGLYLVLTPDLAIVAASDAYLRATMTSRAAIVGRGLFEVFPDNPDDAGATGVRNLRASLERVLATHQPDRMDVQKYDIRRPPSSGGGFEERFWTPSNAPVLGPSGELVFLIHQVEDVTELVRLEQHDEEQNRQLRLAIAQLSEAQEVAHMGSFEWDIRADRVTWSEQLYRVFGVDRSTFCATYGGFLETVHLDDRARVRATVHAAVRDRAPYTVDFRAARGDGAQLVLHARGRIVVDGSGVPVRVTGTCQDITERKLLEEKVVFSSRMSSVGTLAAGVAHEINNPLAYVLSNADFAGQELAEILEAVERDGAARPGGAGWVGRLRGLVDAIRELRQGADRVRNIVRDLKTFARADDEQRGPIFVAGPLESSINIAWSEIRHRARLVKDYADAPAVEGNESRLGQVFVNLLINAAHAIPEGQRDQHEIRVATRFDRGRVVVEIRDTGAGIAPEHLPRIFDPFFTTKAVDAGSGLGLAICHGIVTGLGGEIEVESTLGRGSTFRVCLPPARHDAPAPSAEVPGLVTARRGRVLVVDDEPMVVTALRRTLESEHEVVTLTSAREALALLETGGSFDAIVADLMMPDMTGMELHAEVERTVPGVAARMIFCTGGAFTARGREFLDRVPNLRLDKPFDAAHLRALVRGMVR